ncbi:MAG: hypothetical protein R3B58_03350 [Phycisphaerales bacterium]|nr:hypothetical protein [Phycisphaerales bacterium]
MSFICHISLRSITVAATTGMLHSVAQADPTVLLSTNSPLPGMSGTVDAIESVRTSPSGAWACLVTVANANPDSDTAVVTSSQQMLREGDAITPIFIVDKLLSYDVDDQGRVVASVTFSVAGATQLQTGIVVDGEIVAKTFDPATLSGPAGYLAGFGWIEGISDGFFQCNMTALNSIVQPTGGRELASFTESSGLFTMTGELASGVTLQSGRFVDDIRPWRGSWSMSGLAPSVIAYLSDSGTHLVSVINASGEEVLPGDAIGSTGYVWGDLRDARLASTASHSPVLVAMAANGTSTGQIIASDSTIFAEEGQTIGTSNLLVLSLGQTSVPRIDTNGSLFWWAATKDQTGNIARGIIKNGTPILMEGDPVQSIPVRWIPDAPDQFDINTDGTTLNAVVQLGFDFWAMVQTSIDTPCYPDCDGSSTLNIFDYICFGNMYTNMDPYADCDSNGTLNVFDYICFGNLYAAGCP